MHNYCPLSQLQHLKRSYCISCALREQIPDLVKKCSERKLAHKFLLTRVCANQCKRRRECQETNNTNHCFSIPPRPLFLRIQQMIKNEKQNYCGKDKLPCVLGGEQQQHKEKDHITWVNTFSHVQETDTSNSTGVSE